MQDGILEQTTTEEEIADPQGEAAALPQETPMASMPEDPVPPPAPGKRFRRGRKLPFLIGGAVLLVAIILVIVRLVGGKEKPNDAAVVNDVVMRGSITSVIEGNGLVKPKKSETITVGAGGTVVSVLVNEGDQVTAGTMLYQIDSPGADDAVEKAKKEVDGYQKQLKKLYEDKQNLNVKPEFSGKLVEAVKLKKGDSVTAGQVLARVVDDSKMKLTQYYSYAYEGSIYVGQAAQVSVPSAMQQMSGTVTKINKVERISAEGAKLFSVEIAVDNPGTLTEKLSASATLSSDAGQISPYELGALEYARVTDLKAKVAGEVLSTTLQDYLKVTAGQIIVSVSGENNDSEIFSLEESLKTARTALETAQKNKENLQATAPMDGTVVGLNIVPGATVPANTAVLSIMDNSEMIVEAAIDERSVSYVKPGMMAEIDQFGTISIGTVESVALTGKFENGMSTFPANILVDNAEGKLNSNGSIVYRIQASQSEDCLLLPSQCVKSVADPETGEARNVVFVKADKAPEGSISVDGASLGVPAKGYFAVPVEIGIADKFNVEILSGVEEGTEVFSQVVRDNSMGGTVMIG